MNQQNDPKKVQALREAVKKANDLYRNKGNANYPIYKDWGVSPKALDGLQKHSGNFFKDDPKSLLVIECIALNTLYKTRLWDIEIIPWAERLEKFIKTKGVSPSVEEVEELRREPPEGARHAWVFIPKFFHFFGDKNKYPIIDKFACIAIGVILSKVENKPIRIKRTDSYVKCTERIKEISQMAGSSKTPVGFRELDHLLWIAGHYWDEKCKKAWREMFKEQELKELRECLNKFKMPGWMNGREKP
jgi:hypothetical protein